MPPIQYETDPSALAGREGYNSSLMGGSVLNTSVGAGREVNDLAVGLKQAFHNYYDGDEEKVKAAGEKLARDDETYSAWDDKQIGMEDLGEVAANLGMYATGGKTLNTTLKGSAALGAFIEGLKGTETGSFMESLGQAAGGVAGALTGYGLSHALTKWTPKLEPETEKIIAEQGKRLWKASGIKDLSTGILGRITGVLDKSTTARVLFNGYKKLSEDIKVTDVARRYLTGLDKAQLGMEQAKLAAKRVEQLGAAQRATYARMGKLIDRMDTAGRQAVLVQQTGMTFKDLVHKHKLITDNGDVGVNMGEFIKESPMFAKDYLKAVGPTYAKEIKAIENLWKRQTKKVLSRSEMQAQLQAFADIRSEKTLELLTLTGNLTPKQAKAQSTVLDYIIRTGGSSQGGDQGGKAGAEVGKASGRLMN